MAEKGPVTNFETPTLQRSEPDGKPFAVATVRLRNKLHGKGEFDFRVAELRQHCVRRGRKSLGETDFVRSAFAENTSRIEYI